MKKLCVALFLFTVVSFGAAQVTVQLASPLANSANASPVYVQAAAYSSHPITGWQAYLDGAGVAAGPAGTTFNSGINAAAGNHTLVVRAWDSTGAYGSQSVNIAVSAAGVLPTPPSYAWVFSNIEQMTSGWGTCNTPSCAGGSGEGSYWQAFNQTSPSISGRSMEFAQDGAWSNALFYRQMGPDDGATNFLLDFYIQVDSASASTAQALEFEPFQFVGSFNYTMGMQCDYGWEVWDTWNEATQQWIHTSIPCNKFSAGSWHHIQMYSTTNHSNLTYTYRTLVVDGVAYTLNQTQPALYLWAWADNTGAQWQLDTNANSAGFHEWVDSATLTMW